MAERFFKTDNSSTTNLEYDIVVGKLMDSARRHQIKTSSMSSVAIFAVIGAIIQGIIAIVVLICLGLRWCVKRL